VFESSGEGSIGNERAKAAKDQHGNGQSGQAEQLVKMGNGSK
jgi:hypothetical protein